MKLLSLNVWGGRKFSELYDFLDSLAGEIDIFCFQEVFDTKDKIDYSHEIRANLWQKLKEILPDYHHFYYPVVSGLDVHGLAAIDLTFGSAIFIKDKLPVLNEGDYFIYRHRFAPTNSDGEDMPANVQFVTTIQKGQKLSVYNLHGIFYPGDKLDTPARIEQSEKLLKFMEDQDGQKILSGDFNLMPDTKSIKMIEKKYKNLIAQFGIKTTRSSLNPYQGTKFEQTFADYVFVSNNVKVLDFKVPNISVSDHLPLILEFEI